MCQCITGTTQNKGVKKKQVRKATYEEGVTERDNQKTGFQAGSEVGAGAGKVLEASLRFKGTSVMAIPVHHWQAVSGKVSQVLS